MLAADTLTATEVRGLLTRASAASSSNDGIIAVVDRRGAILGVRVEQGVFDQYIARYGNHGAPTHAYWEKLSFAIDGAVAKARTAASFASGDAVNALSAGGAPLTSRTIRSLSQSTILEREVDSDPNFRSPAFPNPFDSPILGPGVVAPIGLGGHFPPDVNFTPPVDLFNIEFQGRDSLLHPGRNGYKGAATNLFSSNSPADLTPSVGADDITLPGRFNVDVTGELLAQLSPPESWGKVSGFVMNAQARGFATLPGGIPLYKNSVAANGPLGDTLVGGIGVFFPGALGYATFEQGFVPASMRPSGKPQSTLERLNAPRVLEAEWVAYAAAGGSLGAARMYNQPALSVGTLGGVPRGVFDLPFGRIDLVGITLEVFGPNPTQQNPNPGVITLLNKGRQVGSAPNGSSGADVPVTTTAARYLNGKQVPSGWLVAPRNSPLPGGPTAADVSRIVSQGVAQAKLTRAAIRLDLRTLTAGPRTKMVLSVADKAGNVLGIYRMQDATVFSIDVAVAKARNTAYDALLVLAGSVPAADHRDSPSLLDSAVVGSRDINDVYIFRSPVDAKSTVMVMTVNPFAGVLSPTSFEPGIYYDFCIDGNGDAVEDLIYRIRFFDLPGTDTQLFLLQRIVVHSLAGRLGIGLEVTVGFTGGNQSLTGGGHINAGLFDDPFFFDLNGFNNGFQFTGDNFFAGANTSAIVLSVPSKRLTGKTPNIGVWCRTLSSGLFHTGVISTQFDRMGRPAINTALIPKSRKNAFNLGQPVDDQEDFRANVITSLLGLGRTRADAAALADVLLPDILTVDVSNPAGFLNGRRLADDVIDAELNLLSGGAVTTDGVANDSRFRRVFPFLAVPNSIK